MIIWLQFSRRLSNGVVKLAAKYQRYKNYKNQDFVRPYDKTSYMILKHPSVTHFTNSVCIMMTSSNGNISRVTGHLCGEFTGPRWIPRTNASDAVLWCFLWSAPE